MCKVHEISGLVRKKCDRTGAGRKALLLGKAAVPEARNNPSRKSQKTVRVF